MEVISRCFKYFFAVFGDEDDDDDDDDDDDP